MEAAPRGLKSFRLQEASVLDAGLETFSLITSTESIPLPFSTAVATASKPPATTLASRPGMSAAMAWLRALESAGPSTAAPWAQPATLTNCTELKTCPAPSPPMSATVLLPTRTAE